MAFFYTRTTFNKQNEELAKEFRFWEEVNYKTDLVKNLQLLTRLRIEQRSFAPTSTKAAYHAFRYRVRTQLQQKLSNRWAILLADEYMQQHAFNSASVGKKTSILLERRGKLPGQMLGKSPWLQSVHLITDAPIGTILDVDLISGGPNSLAGADSVFNP